MRAFRGGFGFSLELAFSKIGAFGGRVGEVIKPELIKPGFYYRVLLGFFKRNLKKPEKSGFFQDFTLCATIISLFIAKREEF